MLICFCITKQYYYAHTLKTKGHTLPMKTGALGIQLVTKISDDYIIGCIPNSIIFTASESLIME